MQRLLSDSPTSVRLFTAEDSRKIDRLAMKQLGYTAMELVQMAGAAAFSLLAELWPQSSVVSFYCGKGNNAADGYVMAGLAAQQGYQAEVLMAEPVDVLGETLQQARNWALARGICEKPADAASPAGDVIVDALLGTGVKGEVRPACAALIEAINRSNKPVLALDVPSGLHADTGAPCPLAVKASATLTFVVPKRGLLTGAALDHTGVLHFEDLGVPARLYAACEAVHWLRYGDLPRLPPRLAGAHKGLFGRALLIGGAPGLGGATLLASEAALRAGLGLLHVATHPTHIAPLLARCPEAMAVACTDIRKLVPLLSNVDLIACGPGLGRDLWAMQMLMASLNAQLPLILDADALNVLADNRDLLQPRACPTLVTPHPGEAARLLQTSVQAVEADRYGAALEIATLMNAWVILKGAGTVMVSPDGSWQGLCAHGNPGMATGGMGDVLTGFLLGLWAQIPAPLVVCKFGPTVHALAADQLVAKKGILGLLARDMPDEMRTLINQKYCKKID